METILTDPYQPISPEPRDILKEETGLIGDDPAKSQEQLVKQTEEDKVKAEAARVKTITDAIEASMNKQKIAMENTMREIMTGNPLKKESDK